MVNLSEVKGTSRENRTAAHTHIKGLGMRSDGTAETAGNGFVGQTAAREVLRLPEWDLLTEANLLSGLWGGCRSDQSQKDVRSSCTASWWSRNWEDSPSSSCVAGVGDESAVLSNRWQRGVFDRSQEDGSSDGKFSKSHRYDSSFHAMTIVHMLMLY